MKRKILTILVLLLTITLNACSNKVEESTNENTTVDATTNIYWNPETKEINVSTVTIKCNDNYYGVVVNDSINFNNQNNYFTTGGGLTIQIKDSENGIDNGTYNYSAKIEDNAYLFVSGDDEEAVKEVFNNVFKTNKESYQMFSHDITNEWIDNVIITSDVVSFSNGSDTTYIYQNEGSLSEGSLYGKVEPTVFKKQLRGIDIPITYPENVDNVSNYIPYGTETYEHWSNEGYTPYSAYTLMDTWQEETCVEKNQYNFSKTAQDKYCEYEEKNNSDSMTNFIILANNDENVINLFKDKNTHTQNLISISGKQNNGNSLNVESNDLSNIKDIASSVINSENRYHFGIIDDKTVYLYQWSETNKDGYYVDGSGYSNAKIVGHMNGKLVVPTIKISLPSNDNEKVELYKKYGYQYTDANNGEAVIDYAYVAHVWTSEDCGGTIVVSNHGSFVNYENYINYNITSLSGAINYNGYSNIDNMNNYFLLEGDYVYYLTKSGELFINKCVSTTILALGLQDSGGIKGIYYNQNFITKNETIEKKYGVIVSCFASASNNLVQNLEYVSIIQYN